MQSPKWFPAERAHSWLNLAALSLVLLGSSAAADADVPPANFRACAGMSDPAARLACYDAASGRTTAAAPSGANLAPAPPAAPPVVSAASPAESRFGDNGQLRDHVESRRNTPSKIQAYLTHVATLPNGRYILTLDNDQTWQTTESDWAGEFNPQDAVTISRLPLGGYQIAHAGEHRSVGVKRTR